MTLPSTQMGATISDRVQIEQERARGSDVDIVHNDRFARGNRRAADSLVDRYPDMRRGLAHERAEHEHLRVKRIEHVKAHPIVIRKCARDRLRRFSLEQVKAPRNRGRSPNSFEQFGERLERRHARIVWQD
jgi:hypothetical protein